jgi:hypothetical protein
MRFCWCLRWIWCQKYIKNTYPSISSGFLLYRAQNSKSRKKTRPVMNIPGDWWMHSLSPTKGWSVPEFQFDPSSFAKKSPFNIADFMSDWSIFTIFWCQCSWNSIKKSNICSGFAPIQQYRRKCIPEIQSGSRLKFESRNISPTQKLDARMGIHVSFTGQWTWNSPIFTRLSTVVRPPNMTHYMRFVLDPVDMVSNVNRLPFFPNSDICPYLRSQWLLLLDFPC